MEWENSDDDYYYDDEGEAIEEVDDNEEWKAVLGVESAVFTRHCYQMFPFWTYIYLEIDCEAIHGMTKHEMVMFEILPPDQDKAWMCFRCKNHFKETEFLGFTLTFPQGNGGLLHFSSSDIVQSKMNWLVMDRLKSNHSFILGNKTLTVSDLARFCIEVFSNAKYHCMICNDILLYRYHTHRYAQKNNALFNDQLLG